VTITAELEKLGTAFALDLETAMAPLCFQPGQARLIQFHSDKASLYYDLLEWGEDEWWELRAFLARGDLEIYGHNLAFDIRVLLANDVVVCGQLFDSMVASMLLHNGNAKVRHSLAEVSRRELGRKVDKSLQAGGGSESWMVGPLTPERLAYAMDDPELAWECCHVQHEKIAAQGLQDVYTLECALIPAVVSMEHHGIYLDPDAISDTVAYYAGQAEQARMAFLETLDSRLEEEGHPTLPRDEDGTFNTRASASGSVRLGTKRHAGFNLNSSQQVLAYWRFLGIEPVDDAKKPTTDKKVLARYQSDELVRLYLNYRRVEKRKGMAEKLCEHCDEDRRIRARFMPLATGTGRFACVAGETLLPTSRGWFRFDEYEPLEGDLVPTHNGVWQRVLRKIYKGVDQMYVVTSAGGGKLTCTGCHRLLTPGGWVAVKDLYPGASLVSLPQFREEPGQRPGRAVPVQGRGQAQYRGGSAGAWDYQAQRCLHTSEALAGRGVSGREGVALLPQQVGGSQPYAGQEWLPSPSLQGISFRSQGLSDGAGWQRWKDFSASLGDDAGPRSLGAAGTLARSPHRRGPHQQFSGQPGAGEPRWSQGFAPEETKVVSIEAVGPMGVWDIEVEGDHSYLAGGLFNHNSSSPNLQQVPRDAEFRCAFKAPAGRRLVQADYAAMELRVAAAIAKESAMIEAFNAGADIHTRTASLMFGVAERDVEKSQRQQAKAVNFGALYGSSARGVQQYFATLGMFISEKQARELLTLWHNAYPAFGRWHKQCQARAMAGQPVRTVIGRRRLLYGDENRLTVQANNEVQGTSADIMKAALVAIHHQLPPKAFLIACVHDEVLVECEEADADGVAAMVLREMEEAAVPMLGKGIRVKAEGGVLTSWGDK